MTIPTFKVHCPAALDTHLAWKVLNRKHEQSMNWQLVFLALFATKYFSSSRISLHLILNLHLSLLQLVFLGFDQVLSEYIAVTWSTVVLNLCQSYSQVAFCQNMWVRLLVLFFSPVQTPTHLVPFIWADSAPSVEDDPVFIHFQRKVHIFIHT